MEIDHGVPHMSRKIIAILRGVTPDDVEAVGEAILAAGITTIEVPLNSPDAIQSLTRLVREFGPAGRFGAGTVLDPAQVGQVAEAGGQIIVSPDCNIRVIAATKAAGLGSYPGVATPSECFAALRHGADGLKLFPSFLIGPKGLAAIRAVLPDGAQTFAVGGVGPENFADWHAAGVSGFGIGTGIYRPGDSAAEVARRARDIVTAYDRATTRKTGR